ncbi:MAG TPA: PCRF domain-containing protein, partial [Candidatus Kapabacteria bacterium]|nr:PCRF domain-containing protein [Candidatus Kapabacteria bacterium]
MNPFVERLERVQERFNEVEKQLADPNIYADRANAATLQKERANLEKIVLAFQRYKRILQDIASSESILESATDIELKYLAEEELPALKEKCTVIEAELKELLLPKDPDDSRNCIVEIRAGTGGEEAALFAADLYRMYSRYAERHGWKIEVIDFNDTGIGGFKEIIFSLSGQEAYGAMKFESGVHRVQRVPATETSGRIHTSAATV